MYPRKVLMVDPRSDNMLSPCPVSGVMGVAFRLYPSPETSETRTSRRSLDYLSSRDRSLLE